MSCSNKCIVLKSSEAKLLLLKKLFLLKDSSYIMYNIIKF